MDFAWLVIVGIFLFACLTTYAFYSSVDGARRSASDVGAPPAEQGVLAARLDEELALVRAGGADDDGTILRRVEAHERELALACEARGQLRDAELHGRIATAISRERTGEEGVSGRRRLA